MIRAKNETDNLSLSITHNYQFFIERTHRKPEERSEFKLRKSRETIYFNQSINLGFDLYWMIGLITLEICYSTFIITE